LKGSNSIKRISPNILQRRNNKEDRKGKKTEGLENTFLARERGIKGGKYAGVEGKKDQGAFVSNGRRRNVIGVNSEL